MRREAIGPYAQATELSVLSAAVVGIHKLAELDGTKTAAMAVFVFFAGSLITSAYRNRKASTGSRGGKGGPGGSGGDAHDGMGGAGGEGGRGGDAPDVVRSSRIKHSLGPPHGSVAGT